MPSEAAFSDSVKFVRCDRGRLTDAHLEIMMKLWSWNRFIGVVDVQDEGESDDELDNSCVGVTVS